MGLDAGAGQSRASTKDVESSAVILLLTCVKHVYLSCKEETRLGRLTSGETHLPSYKQAISLECGGWGDNMG